jgi:hypothetical protein
LNLACRPSPRPDPAEIGGREIALRMREISMIQQIAKGARYPVRLTLAEYRETTQNREVPLVEAIGPNIGQCSTGVADRERLGVGEWARGTDFADGPALRSSARR